MKNPNSPSSRQTFSIGFVCRKSKANKSGLSPIEMTICINGERVWVQLPFKVSSDEYMKKMSSKRMNDVRQFTSEMYSKAQGLVPVILRDGKVLTAHVLKDYFVNGYSESYRVCDLFDEYLAILRKRTGVDLGLDAFKRYELSVELFYSVCDKKKELSEVTKRDVLLYQAEVMKRYKGSTAYGYMSRLKSFFLYGIGEGRMSVNPFNGIRLRKCEEKVKPLTIDQVKKIEDTHFDVESTDRVKDCFLFQCYTGLSYIDMKMLKKDDICIREDGVRYIKKKRAKTGVEFIVPLIDKAIGILEKYEYYLPVISNQKMNLHLHTIGDVCLGYKNLHTHIGRHTAATLLINSGVSIEVVSKILGHSRIVQTQHYASLLDNTVIETILK